MTQPTDKTGTWPTLQSTIVDDTLVGEPPPPLLTPPPPPPPPDDRFGLGLLLGLLAVLALAGGVIAAYLLTHRDRSRNVTTVVSTVASTTPSTTTAATAAKVLVPSVVGLKEQQALVRIASVGLQPKTVLRQSRQPTGTVLGQRPAVATRVRRGTVVRIVVDGGSPAPKPKPGATTTAQATTTTAQTTTSATTTTTTPATTTTASAPPQPRNATVPDVSGRPEAQAAQALWRAGVVPEFVFVPGTDTLGTVVAQAKPSGTTIPYRGHVQVNLSQGPHASELATVPNVVGQTLQQAVSTLNGAGLRLIFVKSPVTSRAQVGHIVDESPGANAKAPKNAQILVFLGVLHPS